MLCSTRVRITMRRFGSIALLAVAILSSTTPAEAVIYTYAANVNSYMTNTNPSLFGTGLQSTDSVDNGNATNQNQTYTYAQIVNGSTVSVGGTFAITQAEPKIFSYTGTPTNTFATTDASGNLILLPPGGPVVNDAALLTAGNGDQISYAAWWFTGTWQGAKRGNDNAFGGLVAVPEPATASILLLGIAGVMALRRRKPGSAGNLS